MISTTTSTKKRCSSSNASEDANDNDVSTKKLRVDTETNTENEKNSSSATAIVSPPSESDKRYECSDTFSHRAWSDAIRSKENENNAENCDPNHHHNPSTTYIFRCFFQNPNKSLPSFIKCATKKWLQKQLEIRQRPTDGTKKVLLHRLQTDLPYVDIEIDNRECLQFLVASFLHYMEWDVQFSFECSVPNPRRTICGSAVGFFPGIQSNGGLSFDPLLNLALEKGSTINLTYCPREKHDFTITLLDIKEQSTTLPETIVNGCPTRVSLVKTSEAKMPNQYTMKIGVPVEDLYGDEGDFDSCFLRVPPDEFPPDEFPLGQPEAPTQPPSKLLQSYKLHLQQGLLQWERDREERREEGPESAEERREERREAYKMCEEKLAAMAAMVGGNSCDMDLKLM